MPLGDCDGGEEDLAPDQVGREAEAKSQAEDDALFDEVFEGFLPFRLMHDDHYVPDALDAQVVGDDTGRRIRLGDPLRVHLHDIQPLRGRITLGPADRAPRRR